MDALVRYRAWIIMGVTLVAVILAGLLAAGTKGGASSGGAGEPGVKFGAAVAQPAATGQVSYTNGWVSRSGQQTIGVYAGAQASNHRNGLFVIVRTSAGHRRVATVVVRGSGTLTLLRPARPASEQAAFTETLHFVTANGGTGTLGLSGDHATLSG